jgi:hypothetical protein
MSHIRTSRRYFTSRVNNFDTFKFVERLEKEKFTRQQSEAIMSCLRKVITSSMNELTLPMVTKAEKEKVKKKRKNIGRSCI